MAKLLTVLGKTDFESAEITVPTNGGVQVFVNGDVGQTGRVQLLLKGADGVFYGYPSLSFFAPAAVEITLQAGDIFKAAFTKCTSANIEVRQ
jgi:hypothetical protein